MEGLKKEVVVALVILAIIIVISVGLFFMNTLFWNDASPSSASSSSQSTSGNASRSVSSNPATGLTDEQAVEVFNETFVRFLLSAIGAQKLHNPPLSSDTPKINFYIDDDMYKAEVVKGSISVSKGSYTNQDINIKTTKLEAVKMVKDKNYVSKSFSDGGSAIELIAGKTTLFTKGYLTLYEEVTQES